MNRILTAATVLALTACLTFATLAFGNEGKKSPHLKNHFEGKVVVVSSANVPTVTIINPRFLPFRGRIMLTGDEITINPDSDESVGRTTEWSYKRTGGTAYVAWDEATVCIAHDAKSYVLSGDPVRTQTCE